MPYYYVHAPELVSADSFDFVVHRTDPLVVQ